MTSSSNIYNNMCLVGAMDRLWFQGQIIIPLSSQPNISLATIQTISHESHEDEGEEEENLSFKSQSPITLSSSSLGDEDTETDSSSPTSEENNSLPGTPKMEMRTKRKSERFNNSRSNQSLPSLLSRDRRRRSLSRSSSTLSRLDKTSSCKSLGELELEEVKGFLDLGFTFEKEHLSPRMITLIPGLQRLNSTSENEEDKEVEEYDERGVIIRPYLSEAWLIRKPSSPLLNLKVPKASEASDMKKHLKFWAKIVASEIQQES